MRSLFFKKEKRFTSELKKEFQELSDDFSNQKVEFFSRDLAQVTSYLKQLYSFPSNIDFMIREFNIQMNGRKAVLFYIPSMADTMLINEEIIKPLIMSTKVIEEITSSISVSSIQEEKEVQKAIKELNTGSTLLLVEGEEQGYIIKTDKTAGRGVEKPQNETTLLGPKESFIEKADVNISLIRKKIRNADFTVEKMTIGERSNNEVFIIYNKELAGEEVLSEVKARIGAVKKDAVQNLGLLVQHIEDRKRGLVPTILQTERPDRAASFIECSLYSVQVNGK